MRLFLQVTGLRHLSAALALLTAVSSACPPEAPGYVSGKASSDGIGKVFIGREISKVMGHPGIGWLERTEREREEAPSKALEMLKLAPDAVVADIGVGSGYYAFRLAPKVPKGKVIGVDIQPEMLEFLSAKSKELKVTNVEGRLGTVDGVGLPEGSIDAALMVDAYHEFSHPAEMLASIRKALRPKGRIYLLEFRAEDPEVPIRALHKMSVAQARKEFEACGFKFIESRPGLPWQHLLVFERP
ncbi:MAG: class I SAM-dependent methyltransferase [Verrucomicrobiota bacterium]